MYAYRNQYITVSALIDMMERRTQNIHENNKNVTMFIDITEAFDCEDRESHGSKLKIYNFSDNSVSFMNSYLQSCEPLWVKTVVSQGSNIGSFVYNLKMNDYHM